MKKEAIVTLITSLLQDIKDPKTLLLRSMTIAVFLISYLVLTNQGYIADYLKNFSRDSVISQEKAYMVASYPKKAKELALMMVIQANADAVFVTEYTPKFVNNYQDLVAWEGKINVDPTTMYKRILDKTSTMYRTNLSGKDYSIVFPKEPSILSTDFVTSGFEYTTLDLSYMYTCPIFDLDNSYSGYIGLSWIDPPFVTEQERDHLEVFLDKICGPQARTLGRAK